MSTRKTAAELPNYLKQKETAIDRKRTSSLVVAFCLLTVVGSRSVACGDLLVAPNRGAFDLSQSVGAARVSSWTSRLEGTRLKQVGNYWIKEVDPNASVFRQWWGRGSLNAQARALDRLGDMAPSHLYRNGKLVMRDVGEFAGTRGDVRCGFTDRGDSGRQ